MRPASNDMTSVANIQTGDIRYSETLYGVFIIFIQINGQYDVTPVHLTRN